ncbi:hypothetical protein BT63DRAFT_453207 [Microthyrium microscopicum]|uniref:Integral membrane bound transporter domain-containing protein n=1 Tax=Microthyrium microscopicum TaxID=703497 RepID=A0A6A6UF81_9PEZI|nr:hypothetical protein BT63DRAFT_453207 [Microthyrium microscopicum]
MASTSEASKAPRRFIRPSLRQATLVLPKTGEHVRRVFTLTPNGNDSPNASSSAVPTRRRPLLRGSPDSLLEILSVLSGGFLEAANSTTGRGVFKCAIAYTLGSLFTFVPGLTDLLGHGDGKHMVATVSVYFHPARSMGSMLEATGLACAAFVYAAVVSFASMAVSLFFGRQHMLTAGHVIVLIIFCGGGLGAVGWTKQKLGNPLVNVACSLVSLVIITVLTREGSVQAAKFSYDKVVQVLKMVSMGVLASALVSFSIMPRSARKELRDDLVKITDLLEEILTAITRGFLSGSEYDLDNDSFRAAQRGYKSTFTSLVKNLRESKFEHYAVGTADEHEMEVKLVKCIERLAQSLFGLRSAASTQFQLLEKEQNGYGGLSRVSSEGDMFSSPVQTMNSVNFDRPTHLTLDAIVELPESPQNELDRMMTAESRGSVTATGAAEIFSMFISQLGPPMKSLAFTLKEVLNELPFGPPPKYDITFDQNFTHSLEDARDLYITARKEALEMLYTQRVWARNRSPEVAADYEEVAASCGHFSSSLEDFAEDTIHYLEILDDLKDLLQAKPRQRSWNWLKFWKRKSPKTEHLREEEERLLGSQNPESSTRREPSPHLIKHPREQKIVKNRDESHRSVQVWKLLAPLRREDIKYAIKVGTGAVIYAMFSFIPATRPIYALWRGEWGLLSYMLVASMTIGASNTTGLQRFIGTCMGAIIGVLSWIISTGNPVALAFFGWLVSLWCFYIILGQGKGPMGRFILLTYNLSCLYAYSLSAKDDEDDDDEGGNTPDIYEIVGHRVVAVISGCLWGIIVTRLIWPISARRKVKDGTALLWLRMGLIWKRDPLQILLDGPTRSTYMDIRESIDLQRYLNRLEALRSSATHEFDLRGPFADATYSQILERTGRLLGSFHAMSVVISKDLKASPGEAELLQLTTGERKELSARISHLFSVLASSMKLEYPMNDTLPNIEHARDRFLAKLFACRKQENLEKKATDEDFEVLYAYGLVTGQIADEIEGIGKCIEQLYGVLDEDSLKLR